MFLAGQPPMPSTLLTADFKRLDAITHLGKVGYFDRSWTTVPFTRQRVVLERADKLLMRDFRINGYHAALPFR
jgi:hypothetical protein